MTETVLMDLAMTIGHRMICCGGEIYRVEESIERIFRAYTGREAHVFSIPSSLLVTYTGGSGESLTQSRRILTRSNNLDQLEQLNDLCRRMCRETPEEPEIRAELERIRARRCYSLPAMTLAYGMMSLGFTLMFGGSWADALAAGILGAGVKLLHRGLERLRTNEFFLNLVCSWFLTSLAALAAAGGLVEMDTVIVGTIMTLVPGFTLTGSMRDFIVGDSVAGLVKLVEALLVSVGLAVGTALALYLLRSLW